MIFVRKLQNRKKTSIANVNEILLVCSQKGKFLDYKIVEVQA